MLHPFIFIFLVFFFPYFLNAQSADYFTDWERVSIESKSLGKVYYKDGKLVTLQPSKGVFTSIDQGRTWELASEFHADVSLPDSKIEIKNDGMYLTKNSVIPDAYTSPITVHYNINHNGEISQMNSYARQFSFCCSGSLIAAEYGFNGSSAMTTRFSNMGNPDVYEYRIFDATDNHIMAVDDKPEEKFLGKIGNRYLWETSGRYQLLDSIGSNPAYDFIINGSSEFVIIYPEQILVCNLNGEFELLNGNTLDLSSGVLPMPNSNLISNAVLNSDNILRLKIGSEYYHADVLNPENLTVVLEKNEENYEILITTDDWVLGRDGLGKFALTQDKGYTWETYYPLNLDYVSKVQKMEDELIVKNYDNDYYASCDLEFLAGTIDLAYESIRFQGVTFQLINNNIYATLESNAPVFPISNFPAATELRGFLIHDNELYVYGNRLVKVNAVNLSTITESLSFDADLAKSHNGIIYTIKGITFNRIASDYSATELFERYKLDEFFINDNAIMLFANENYYSTDQGNSFMEVDGPDLISGSLLKQRELIIGKVDKICSSYGSLSWDNGISWDQFLVPEVANNSGRYEWSCNTDLEQGQVAFGFVKDEAYLYALAGNYGLFRAPLFSDLETTVDSTINFCVHEGVIVDGQMYNESDTIFLIREDAENCEQLLTLAIIANTEYIDTIDVAVASGESYLDVVILNDTVLIESTELSNGCISTTVHNIALLTNTSNLLEHSELTIFPNPVNQGDIFIEWPNTIQVDQLIIYNTSGEIMHRDAQIGTLGKYTFESAQLRQGIYFIQLIGVDGVSTGSLLKL